MSLLSQFRFIGKNFELYHHKENPLPECPHSYNCARTTFRIEAHSEIVMNWCENVLDAIGAVKIQINRKEKKASSVFRVLFFKDDFLVKLQEDKNSTLVHVRSASRAGCYDLGVNRNRIKRFYNALERAVNQ